jgi:N-acetylglucosaminyldiphosphoundecaprenol N-acetyl-beta-D-mannosaminyltransferase
VRHSNDSFHLDIERSILDVRYLFMASSMQILGIHFFNGNVDEAIALMSERGGFLIAPSGTCFGRLRDDERYRRAAVLAGLALPDSGLMVLLSRMLQRGKVQRISGLKYLKHLLQKLKDEGTEKICWVLSSERAKEKLFDWSRRENFPLDMETCYVAPWYGLDVEDRNLVGLLEQNRPSHVIVAIGSGAQEKLGYYLRENLSYRPAIHCIGAALGFVTGEQIPIPDLADRLCLGWLLRLMTQPQRFIPRLIRGLELPWLIWKYGENLPPPGRRSVVSDG